MITAAKVVAILGLVCSSVPALATGEWHRPENHAEAALAQALAVFETDDASGFVALFPERFVGRHSQSLPNLEEVLTPALVASIRQAEKRMVDKWCGGHYLQSDSCGMNFSPIFCAQDWPLAAFVPHQERQRSRCHRRTRRGKFLPEAGTLWDVSSREAARTVSYRWH